MICLLLTVLSGCTREEPIRLGFIGGTSGRVADLGIAGRDGVQLAVEMRNQSGGIDGRKIRLLTKDDQQQQDKARSAFQELVAEGALAIVGPMTSDMGLAIASLADKAKILVMSPTVTTEALAGRDDYFFRVSSTTRFHATRNARFQLAAGGLHHISAAYDLGNRSFSENWLENFSEAFASGGGEIIHRQGFESNADTDFQRLAQDLLAPRPDGVLIVANSMDSALLCQQLRKLESQTPITLADWGATERLLELGGKAVEGVTVVQTFDRQNTSPAFQAFRRAYLERFKREPGFAGVYAFEAANVVLDALASHDKERTLKETVLGIGTFTGLQSQIQFDAFGDVQRPNVSISVVRDGKFVVVN